jgi:hypothetical protein
MDDKGVQKDVLPKALQDLAANQPLTIVFTKNIGPHRRLLPLLSKFWKTDCVIIALDDDRSSEYTQHAVEKLLSYYIHSGKSAIVALKVIHLSKYLYKTLAIFLLNHYRLSSLIPPIQKSNQQQARRIGLCAGLEKVSAFDACSWPVIDNEKTELVVTYFFDILSH